MIIFFQTRETRPIKATTESTNMTSSTNNNYLPHLSDASHPTMYDKGKRQDLFSVFWVSKELGIKVETHSERKGLENLAN